MDGEPGPEKAGEGTPQYYVNFSPELTEIITETKYLEQLGLVPLK